MIQAKHSKYLTMLLLRTVPCASDILHNIRNPLRLVLSQVFWRKMLDVLLAIVPNS